MEELTGPRLLPPPATSTNEETLDSVQPPETLNKIDEEEPSDSTTGSQLTVKSMIVMDSRAKSTSDEELLSDTPANIVSLE